MNRRNPTGQLIKALALLASAWVATATGAPKVSVKSEPNLGTYTKAYLAPINNDELNVKPLLLARLKQAGFEAVEFDADNLPFPSQGSGFVLTPEGHVLTCAHVTHRESQTTLWIEGKRYVGRVLTIDTNLDAALIKVEDTHPPFHCLSFSSDTNYHLGQEVFTLGFPMADMLGKSPRINKGLISSTVGLGDLPWKLQTSAEVQAGNSGGPLLNQGGEVLGMVDSTINPSQVWLRTGGELPQNVNFAIKNAPLLEFLANSHLSLPARTNAIAPGNFEDYVKGLALIRSGIVDEKRLYENPLVCRCIYQYAYGPPRHFVRAWLFFVDVKKLKLVLTVSLDRVSFSSLDKVMDALFAEACDKFAPDRPNPFRPGKAKKKTAKP